MIKPVKEYVLLERVKTSNKTKCGILLDEKIINNIGVIIELGDKVEEYLKKQQQVIFIENKGIVVNYDDKEYIIINFKDIISVIE